MKTNIIETIETLDDLLQSTELAMHEESTLGNDLFINDPDRAERINASSENGGDGSFHGEHIQDWRDCLDCLDLSDETKGAIAVEIDTTEKWHEENGSLWTEVG